MDRFRKEIEQRISALNWSIPKGQIIELIRPCIRIKTNLESEISIGRSKFGGLPDMKEKEEWPYLNGKPLAKLGAETTSLSPNPKGRRGTHFVSISL